MAHNPIPPSGRPGPEACVALVHRTADRGLDSPACSSKCSSRRGQRYASVTSACLLCPLCPTPQ